MDPTIRTLLACTRCGGELRWEALSASCSACSTEYAIENDIPLFIDCDRSTRSRRRLAALTENERLYDLIQRVLGYPKAANRLKAALGDTSGRVVLDVGGGTGNLIPYLAADTRYVCLDNDVAKLERLREKRPGTTAILADAAQLPFRDGTVDDTVCVAVTHHLDDEGLDRLVGELRRVTRQRVVVLDPLYEPRSRRGLLLWRIDRGSFRRGSEALSARLERRLTPIRTERFSIHHHYFLWVGRPDDERTDASS